MVGMVSMLVTVETVALAETVVVAKVYNVKTGMTKMK
jgi:hypothetical protein